VAVPDQVHLGRVDVKRVVYLQVEGVRGVARRRRVRDAGVERGGLAARLARLQVARREGVQRDAERGEIRPGNQPAGMELVERGPGVAEPRSLDEQLVRLEAEQPAQRD